MTTGLDVLRWAVAIFLAAMMAGLSGFAVYAALYTVPRPETPWAGRALHWLGHGLIYATIALIVGAILGAGVVGGIAALGR